MTSTSVKDVSTVMNSFVPSKGSNVAASSQTSFQDVWNSQTGRNQTGEATATEDKKTSNSMDHAKRGEALKAKDAVKVKPKEATAKEAEPLDEKKLEEAMEVLGTVGAELMQEIADTFGISMEELEQLMVDMNLEAADLMDPKKLSALLLEAGGATDSLALLTDEGLCNNFQILMNRQKELFNQISEVLQISPEQLTELVEEMDTLKVGAQEMPQEDLLAQMADEQEPQIMLEVDESQPRDTQDLLKGSNVLTEEATVKVEMNTADEAMQNTAGESNADTAKEQTGNLLLQNLKAENFNAELAQISEKASSWNETTQDIMRQIMDYMKIQVKPDTSSLTMQLHPESLGTLEVHVASKGGVLTANFVTQNEMVKAALESQMVQLQESFAEQGVKVEAIEVTVQTHQFESNLEQGRGRQQEEPARKGKTRRINLNTPLDMEEMEAMTEAEQLAADMMTANGNTVDYTA